MAQTIVLDESEDGPGPHGLIIPYAFYSESLELAVGAGMGTSGNLQPQTKFFATVFVTRNESRALFVSLIDYQVPFARRTFIEFVGSTAHYTDQRVYTGFNSDFPGEHAGSNDSSDDNFIQGEGDDDWYDLKFKFLLPIGQGKHTLINTYTLKNGLLVDGQSGGDVWNPMTSGRTNLELSIFNRHRTIINDSGENVGDSNGGIIALEYDNRDFFANPAKGSLQKITIKRDFGFKSSDNWSVAQLDLRKYYDLGRTSKLRQSVLALDYWTSYTRSWNPILVNGEPFIDGRPPNELG